MNGRVKLTDEQIQCLRAMDHGVDGPTPDAVVKEARKKGSPLHALFDWDKDRAALAAWRQRAREIIGSISYIYSNEEFTIKADVYAHLDSAKNQQRYINVQIAGKTNPEVARRLVRQEFVRAAGYLQRARDLAIVLGLSDDIALLLDELLALQSRIDRAA